MIEPSCLTSLFLTSIFWGLNPYFYTKGIRAFNNYNFYILHGMIYTIIILLFIILNYKKIKVFKNDSSDYIYPLTSSLLTALGIYFLYNSINKCKKSYKVVAITYTLPVILATFCSIVFLKESIKFTNIIGIILALLGIQLIYN